MLPLAICLAGLALAPAVGARSIQAPFDPSAAPASCPSSGTPVVTTDKGDYSPHETATISGTCFGSSVALSVLVTAPDGSTYAGNGTDLRVRNP
jgi:hypothetical protein